MIENKQTDSHDSIKLLSPKDRSRCTNGAFHRRIRMTSACLAV